MAGVESDRIIINTVTRQRSGAPTGFFLRQRIYRIFQKANGADPAGVCDAKIARLTEIFTLGVAMAQ